MTANSTYELLASSHEKLPSVPFSKAPLHLSSFLCIELKNRENTSIETRIRSREILKLHKKDRGQIAAEFIYNTMRNKHNTRLSSPAMSCCWTPGESLSISPNGTRNPSVVHDIRALVSFVLTVFAVLAIVSSDILTLRFSHKTANLDYRAFSVKPIHQQGTWG